MGELKKLTAFEFRLIFKNPLFVGILCVISLLFPIIVFLLENQKDDTYWILSFHIQMIMTILASSTFVSFLWNEEIESFIPEVILNKLEKPYYYLICKSIVIWMVVVLSLFFINALLMVMSGDLSLLLLLQLLFISISTIGFSIQLVFFLSLLLKRIVYINIFIIIFFLIGITINQPILSIWFNPDVFKQYMLNGSASFFIGRLILFLMAVFLLVLNSYIFTRRIRV
ncbi:hypothetical protein ACEOWJ_001581 [Bacillus cereus]|uniref:hypothetical protein n=1 Tax=Bacillus TaxID=1386 RepID=UPI0005543496|nr:hypothetical protein [Bacillus sp. UNC322MFChir4.1]